MPQVARMPAAGWLVRRRAVAWVAVAGGGERARGSGRQMPAEPVARLPAGGFEALGVGLEMAAWQDDEFLGLVRGVEGGVGSADGASGSESTTGTIAGGSTRKRASRSASNCSRNPAMKSARTSARRLAWPLISGTWQTTALTRRSTAATTRTWPPE